MNKVKIGQRLDIYQDGKRSPSRLSVVKVVGTVQIRDLSKGYLRMWKKAINEDFKESLLDGFIHYVEGPQRFWDWNCDTFIFGEIVGNPDTKKDPVMFARRASGKYWYGVNWNYMLDIKGDIRKSSLPTWRKCAAEMGQKIKWNPKVGKFEYFDIKTGKKMEAE